MSEERLIMPKKIKSERFIWVDIMITLLALEIMAYFYYGIRAAVLGCVCVGTSLLTDIVCIRLMNRKFTANDLSGTSDGLIIALMLPAVFDFKIAAIACFFAAAAAKNVFGGRRNMIFSPAAAAYVFLAASWGKKLLLYPKPHVRTGILDEPSDLVSSASHVYNSTGKFDYSDFETLLGNFSGPAGAVSILLLVVAAVILIFRRDISAGAFIGTIIGTALFAFITPPVSYGNQVGNVLATNMILFAAIYIVADKRTAPKTEFFAFFYGLFIGVFSYVMLLTTAKENVIVPISLLFTPAALAIRNLEKKIDLAIEEQNAADTDNSDETYTVPDAVEDVAYTNTDTKEDAPFTENDASEADVPCLEENIITGEDEAVE